MIDYGYLRRVVREEIEQLIEELNRRELKPQPPLSIGQTAIRYNVSKQTVHNWINRGIIIGSKIGKNRYFDVHELERNLKDFERNLNKEKRQNRLNNGE